MSGERGARRVARQERARASNPIPLAVALTGARCVGMTDLMYSDERADVAAAKALCATCPVSVACVERAVANRERFGVWAGVAFNTGTAVRFPREARRFTASTAAGEP